MEVVQEVEIIEADIEDVKTKCNKIECSPLYNAINAVIKLITDLFKCIIKTKSN